MCGIAGIFQLHPLAHPQESIERMTNVLAHRGPDGRGHACAQHGRTFCALGHRRLAIIDIDGGKQPMLNDAETVWLSYNGEIYNHVELRRELVARGYRYRTSSDTETLLHAYEEWGVDLVARLRGMFAFAIWDARKETLLLVRDRLGIKPLYYHCGGDHIVFASEIKAILASGLVEAQVARDMLPEQMTFGYLAGDKTLFAGIRKLPPGHLMTWNGGSIDVQQYWDVPEPRVHPTRTDAELIDGFRERFDTAVEMRLMSDVPLGVFLSGGLDSSAIAATMAPRMSGRLKTFSVGFESDYYSEFDYARQMAGHLDAEHHEIVLTPDDFFASLPRLVWHEDEPIRSAPSVALYHVARLARDHVKVVLTGEGSDELFAGYDRYWATLFNLRWGNLYCRTLPTWLRERVIRGILSRWPLPRSLKRKLGHTFLARGMSPEELIFDNWYAIFPQATHSQLFAPDLFKQIRDVNPYEDTLKHFARRSNGDPLEQMLYSDQKTYLVELLMKQDNMSMAASIESRVPFLDHELVEFAAGVPGRWKLDGRGGKRLVKHALADRLPPSILNRKKTGFPVPFAAWLQRGFDGGLEALLTSDRTRERGLLNPVFLTKMLEENRRGLRDHTEPLWTALNLELWARIYLDGESVDNVRDGMTQGGTMSGTQGRRAISEVAV